MNTQNTEARKPELLDIVSYKDEIGVNRHDQIVAINNGIYIGKFAKEKLNEKNFRLFDSSFSY